MNTKKTKFIHALAILFFLTTTNVWAQTSEFAYQGKLSDAGNSANGTYQMEFKLFGSLSGADQIGAMTTKPSVSVTNGVFNVGLDFGAAAFDGTAPISGSCRQTKRGRCIHRFESAAKNQFCAVCDQKQIVRHGNQFHSTRRGCRERVCNDDERRKYFYQKLDDAPDG
jgi:hypothetical protein